LFAVAKAAQSRAISCRFFTVFRRATIRLLAAAICPLASCINLSNVVNTLLLTGILISVNLPFVPNYNVMLGELQEEFKRTITERELLDRRIAGLMKAMEAVKVLAEDASEPIVSPPPIADEAGFTDKVRNLLKANPARSFTAVDIRDVFLEFYPKADPKVMLIHTHNTLKRLLKQNEVEEVIGADGKSGYRWLIPKFDVGKSVMEFLQGLQNISAPPPGSPGVTLPTQDDIEDTLQQVTRKADRIARIKAQRDE
jgi:hypothetical protein